MLVAHNKFKHRSLNTVEGRAALIHAMAHILNERYRLAEKYRAPKPRGQLAHSILRRGALLASLRKSLGGRTRIALRMSNKLCHYVVDMTPPLQSP